MRGLHNPTDGAASRRFRLNAELGRVADHVVANDEHPLVARQILIAGELIIRVNERFALVAAFKAEELTVVIADEAIRQRLRKFGMNVGSPRHVQAEQVDPDAVFGVPSEHAELLGRVLTVHRVANYFAIMATESL